MGERVAQRWAQFALLCGSSSGMAFARADFCCSPMNARERRAAEERKLRVPLRYPASSLKSQKRNFMPSWISLDVC